MLASITTAHVCADVGAHVKDWENDVSNPNVSVVPSIVTETVLFVAGPGCAS